MEECHVFATEYFGDETTAGFQDVRGDVESGEEELCLDVLVEVVKAGNYRNKMPKRMKTKRVS